MSDEERDLLDRMERLRRALLRRGWAVRQRALTPEEMERRLRVLGWQQQVHTRDIEGESC